MPRIFHFLRKIVAVATAAAAIAWNPEPGYCLPGTERGEFPALCYHEVREDPMSPYSDSVPQRTYQFISQLNWLYENGYTTLTVDDLIAIYGGTRQPAPKEFLLTIDDGYASFHKYVFPLLKAYNYSAVLAINGNWIEGAPGTTVDYGAYTVPREFFLDISQVREISDSGLVEIASHSYNLHRAVSTDAWGSLLPQAVTLGYDTETHRYQTPGELYGLVGDDMKKISETLFRITGKRPRVHVWPFGRYTKWGERLAQQAGMQFSFVLKGEEENELSDLPVVFRYLVLSEETAGGIAWQLRTPWAVSPVRTVKVDMDDLYDPDPDVVFKRLDLLIQRLYEIKPSSIVLKGYSDTNGDGRADALYFPNRHLPVRADLLSLVSWRLERKITRVTVSMPMRAFDFTGLEPRGNDDIPMSVEYDDTPGRESRMVREIYEDLASHVVMQGIHFDDFGKYLREVSETDVRKRQDAVGFEKIRALSEEAHMLEKILLNWSEAKPGGIYSVPASYFLNRADPAEACASLGLGTYGTGGHALVDFEGEGKNLHPLVKRLHAAMEKAPQYAQNLILNFGASDTGGQASVFSTGEIADLMVYAQRNGFRNLGLSFYDFVNDAPQRAGIIPAFSLRSFEYEVRRPDVVPHRNKKP